MPYITGSKKDREKAVTEEMIERMKHESAKRDLYAKVALNWEVYRSSLSNLLPSNKAALYDYLPKELSRMIHDKTQPIINRIVPVVKYYTGALSQSIFPRVVPDNLNRQTLAHAKLKEEALLYFYREGSWSERINLASLLRFVYGDGFLKPVWDYEFKPMCQCYSKWLREKEALMKMAAEGREIAPGQLLSVEDIDKYIDYDPEEDCFCNGGIVVQTPTFWEIIPNQEALNTDMMMWYIHKMRYNRDLAKEKFNSDKEGFFGNGDKLSLASLPVAGQHPLEKVASPLYNFEEENITECFVEECWERPSKKYPRGRLIITGNEGQIALYEGPLPYERVEMLNLFRFGDEQLPGSFWSDTLISRMIPIQNSANDFVQRIAHIIKKIALIKTYVCQEAYLKKDLTDVPEDIQPYSARMLPPGHAPVHQVPAPNPPQYVYEMIRFYVQMIDHLSGYFEMQRGEMPPEVSSGIMFDRAMEQSNKKLKPIIDRDICTYNKFFSFCLSLMEEYAPDDFYNRFIGQGKAKYVYSIDKTFKETTHNIHCEPSSVFQMSALAKTEQMMRWVEMQAVPPEALPTIWKLAGYGGMEELEELERPGEMNAQEENMRWLEEGKINEWLEKQSGRFLPVPYENKQAHMDSHTEFTRTEAFRAEPIEKQRIMFKHMEDTQAAIEEEQWKQIEMQRKMMEGMGSPPKPTRAQEMQQGPKQ